MSLPVQFALTVIIVVILMYLIFYKIFFAIGKLINKHFKNIKNEINKGDE